MELLTGIDPATANTLVAVLGGIIGAALLKVLEIALNALKKLVLKTETKVDDELLEAVLAALDKKMR